ncbi:MAG: IS66 family transposase [Cyanobacteria bacterium P01_H01_bin.153]
MTLNEANEKILALEQENQLLRERLAELERRLSLDSGNSSKPPSSDGLSKRQRRTQSLRNTSNCKKGGQRGHPGQTLEAVSTPEVIIEHPAPEQCHCGCDVWHLPVINIVKRQVFDIPPPHIVVTEHQVQVKRCPQCQQNVQAPFPENVKAPVQYGPRIRAIATYLNHQHFIPEERLSELLNDLFSCSMSAATIVKLSNIVRQSFEPLMGTLRATLNASPVTHLDETGLRISGRTHWLHVVSTATETWYRTALKRKDLEPLKTMTGIVVHDHWKPYFQLEGVAHSLCNAHHLRELKALQEIEQESWATSMGHLLRVACRYKHRYVKGIPEAIQVRIERLYQQIVARGLTFHEALDPLPQKSGRGRLKRRVGHNLLLRLKQFETDVLRFLRQSEVPFSNNQAERDLRMMKLKQKISGGFRSSEGARSFAVIRSVLSTARKRGLNLLEVLSDAVQGKTPKLVMGT